MHRTDSIDVTHSRFTHSHLSALTSRAPRAHINRMDTALDHPWTTETFLAWEDRQEGKHEFDGVRVIPPTGPSVAHQEIVFNICVLLARLLTGGPLRAVHAMRLRIGDRVRYPDVVVCPATVPQTQRTLTDAVVVFEVLSDDTATTDRVAKLHDYAAIPSLRYYVMLEQTSRGAILCQRAEGETWITSALTQGAIALIAPDLLLPLDDIYQGLVFPADA